MPAAPQNIDEYIAQFEPGVQQALQTVRQTITSAAPGTAEVIKYKMPGMLFNGTALYFAAFKKHIGLYSVPTGVAQFEQDFSAYKTARGSIQFPLNKPMPVVLIIKIVQYKLSKAV